MPRPVILRTDSLVGDLSLPAVSGTLAFTVGTLPDASGVVKLGKQEYPLGAGTPTGGASKMAQRVVDERPPERPPTAAILGANVYRRRVLRLPKMSQEKLAEVSGVAVNTIYEIEAGRDPERATSNSPQLNTLEKLAAGLGCEPADLLRWEPEATRANLKGKRHLSAIDGGRTGPRDVIQAPLLR